MEHISVLLHESIEALGIVSGDTVVDATVGDGGHSLEIWKRYHSEVRIIGIDQDPTMLERAKGRLRSEGCDATLILGNFRRIENLLANAGIQKVNRVLFDLGVSSPQIDGTKGFSFRTSAFLDMRFSPDETLTAYEVVNRRSERELAEYIREYGEERYAGSIARAIVSRREKHEIERADELARIIEESVPPQYRKMKIHPATRTFQALRIVVNDELSALSDGLVGAWNVLFPGGAIAVISFHSLEDRIVKRFMKEASVRGEARLGTKKPVRPSAHEIAENPRARSAKLRSIKKL